MSRRAVIVLIVFALTLLDAGPACRAGGNDDAGKPLPDLAIARLGARRWRWDFKNNGRSTLAFSGDGKWVAATGTDGLVIWDSATGKAMPGSPSNRPITGTAFLPDGKTLVTVAFVPSETGSGPDLEYGKLLVQHWDIGTRKLVRAFEVPHESPHLVNSKLSRDGRFLLHGGDGETIVSSAEDGKQIGCVKVMLYRGWHSALKRDGKTLAVVHWKGAGQTELHLHDVATGKIRRVLYHAGRGLELPAFSRDGKLVVASASDGLRVWDTATGKLLKEVPGSPGPALFSHDGQLMALAGPSSIRLYAVPAFTEVRRADHSLYATLTLAFSADGKRLVAGHEDIATLWDVLTGKRLSWADGHEAPICSLAWAPDGRTLASGSHPDGVALVWNVPKRQVQTRYTGHFLGATALAFSSDGSMLATGDGSPGNTTGGGQRSIRLWNLADGTLLRKFQAHINDVHGLEFAPDKKTLLSVGGDARVRLWDVATGARLAQVRGDEFGLLCAHFSRDGRTLLVADGSGALSFWRPDMKKKLRDLWVSVDEGKSLAFAAFTGDGTRVFASEITRPAPTDAGQVAEHTAWMFFDSRTNKGVRKGKFVTDGSTPANYRALAPDGRTLAVAAFSEGSYKLELWDVETKTRLARLPPEAGSVVAFSPDSKTLATASPNATILLWDLQRARRMHLFEDVLGNTGPAVDKARSLAADPKRGVAFLKQLLAKFAAADKVIAPLVADLDSELFEERDHARRELDKLGLQAEAWLRAAASKQVSLEMRRRLQQLLEGLPTRDDEPPLFEVKRAILTIAVLEQLDSAEARAAITEIARHAPKTDFGRAAKAAQRRLKKSKNALSPK